MIEVQEAAKIITESIDPQAKVIFGTIKDEKLKKNEVKVTVIATGFPGVSEGGNSEGISEDENEADNTRGKIFNSLPNSKRQGEGGKRSTNVKEARPVDPIDEEDGDEDDWGAVPAFLRRSKIK